MRIDKKISLPSIGTDAKSVQKRVEAMERVLEHIVTIPGIKRDVGLDVILDVVPVVGDIAAAALGSYIVWEAKNLGMSKWQMARMSVFERIKMVTGMSKMGAFMPGAKMLKTKVGTGHRKSAKERAEERKKKRKKKR